MQQEILKKATTKTKKKQKRKNRRNRQTALNLGNQELIQVQCTSYKLSYQLSAHLTPVPNH